VTLALTDARTALHAVLAPLLPAGRVHLYPPDQLVAPCAWIDQPSWTIVDGLTVAEFPIHLVADGNPPQQCQTLDAMADAAWTLMVGPYIPLTCDPSTVESGSGVDLHQYVIAVQVCVDAVSFCPPTPATVPAWPVSIG
jgi:hypothetical protein